MTNYLGLIGRKYPGRYLGFRTVGYTFNDIGEQGGVDFGVGITNKLQMGMGEMLGTRVAGNDNHGNYQYEDGSVMAYVPAFYYRWGSIDSPRFGKYGVNALDVKSIYDFAGAAAANAAGYALHRAFYDNGEIKDGFFVDKYQASNNSGIASSVKNGNPLSSNGANNPFSGLNGSPANNYYGAIDAIKTRGPEFFVTTIFIQRALSMLSLAHAQAAEDIDNCAWYDETGVNNFPKGNNNNALRDVNDTSVLYEATGYSNAGKTGSAVPFAKTTHNGQASGVADLNGNMWEISIGITHEEGSFHALKTTAKAALLTSGNTAATDVWGLLGVSENYEPLGTSIGALTGSTRGLRVGSATSQVFSNAQNGTEWQAAGAGIPLATGVSGSGTNDFGSDYFYDYRREELCPIVGGSWSHGSDAGVWCVPWAYTRAHSGSNVGFRSALY